ncbi:MAG: histidine phosphatase family protein [Bacteroidetes bacterium]|nr:histidine phosphatase family protein [Bacteroidota bacterium]
MKKLCIIRHAKTEVQQQGQLDFDRKLAKRAYEDVPQIAHLLKDKKISPDLILSSPAMRAISTAHLFSEKLHYPEHKIEQNSLIYNASVSTLLKVIQGISDDYKTVFLVGHNPGMTLLANLLCMPPILHIPTSGAVYIDLQTKHWSHVKALCGKQEFFIHPH